MSKLITELIDILKNNSEYMTIALLIIVAAIIITLVINFIARKLKFIKYLPGLVFTFIGLFSIFSVMGRLFESNSLNNILIFIIFISAGIVSLLLALILGILSN